MRELPEGWVEVELGEVIEPKETRNPRTDGSKSFCYIDVKAVDNVHNRVGLARHLASRRAPSRARRLVRNDDVLFCLVRPYLRNVALVPPELHGQVASTAFCVLRSNGAVASRFLFHQVLRDSFIGEVPTYGTSPPSAREDEFLKQRIPLAPLPEQHRIVAKFESLFAKLDEAVAAIRRAQANLERYRASVLKAAVEGRLTERWRSENPPGETGEELVKRTPTPQRPNRYGTRFRGVVAGHSALSLGATGLPLPSSWCWAPLVDLARLESGHTPSRRRPDWWDGDVPWVGIKDARAHHGGTIHKTLQMTNEAGLANSAARLLPANTVCLSRTASVGYVVVLGRSMATSQDFVNWICTDGLDTKWLQIVFLADPKALRKFGKGSTHTTIYFPEVLSLHVAVPPLPEQRVIATEVDKRLRDCAKQETLLKRAHTHATALRQSILKRAFEGRLVSQDPADEPASVLLGRIRAQRRVRS